MVSVQVTFHLSALPFSLRLFVEFTGNELWLAVWEGVLCTRSGLPLESLAVPDLRPTVKEETYWPRALCLALLVVAHRDDHIS